MDVEITLAARPEAGAPGVRRILARPARGAWTELETRSGRDGTGRVVLRAGGLPIPGAFMVVAPRTSPPFTGSPGFRVFFLVAAGLVVLALLVLVTRRASGR